MKIGAFAALHGVSIDTVRHYMDLGLLIPEKQGSQYIFDKRCGDDLEEINSLKTMNFALAEIRTIIMFRRLGKQTSYKEDTAFHQLFIDKYNKVTGLLEELKQVSSRLETKIRELDSTKVKKPFKLGVQLRNLGLLSCASCHGELILSQAQVTDNQIMEGSLVCKCGMQYVIEDGILLPGLKGLDGSGNVYDGNTVEAADSLNFDQVSDYIKSTDDAYLQNVYKSLEWAYRKLDFNELDGRIMLELGSGIGFFLRLCYEDLPENTVYIAVDREISVQRSLKHILEMSGTGRNILFICADFLEVPIRDKAADIVLDLAGTSNYSFDHEEFLLKPALRYFSDHAYLLGSYILFRNFSADSKVAAGNRRNFKREHIKTEISALGFQIVSEAMSDFLEKGGKYESYFTNGEQVNSCVIYAKRLGLHEV